MSQLAVSSRVLVEALSCDPIEIGGVFGAVVTLRQVKASSEARSIDLCRRKMIVSDAESELERVDLQLAGVIDDRTTKWPPGFVPPQPGQ